MQLYVQGPHLLLHFRQDEALVEALSAYDGDGALFVSGAGALTDIVLEDAAGEHRKVGAAEALSLSGTVIDGVVSLSGTFLRGAQALGGRVVKARVVRCVMHGERFAPVDAASVFSPESIGGASTPTTTGWAAAAAVSSAAEQPAPKTTAKGASKAPGGWAAAIAASEEAEEEAAVRPPPRRSRPRPAPSNSPLYAAQKVRSAKDRAKRPEFLDEPELRVGDFVEHKQFGICRVQRVSDDGGLLIKLPTGRTKQIKLTVLEVLPARTDTDRVIYPLRSRKRG